MALCGACSGTPAGWADIIGDWESLGPYTDDIASEHVARITTSTFTFDWTSEGDAYLDLVSADDDAQTAVLVITDDETTSNIGLFLKIGWVLRSSSELEISYYDLRGSADDAEAESKPVLGVLDYVAAGS